MWRLINIESGKYVERIDYFVKLTSDKKKALLIPDEKIKQFTKTAHELNKNYTFWPEEIKKKIYILEVVTCLVWAIIAFMFVIFGQKVFLTQNETINTEKEIPQVIQKSLEISSVSFAEEISKAVRKTSKKYRIPEYVIYAIIATESCVSSTSEINEKNITDVNRFAKSKVNCLGLMQISPIHALKDYNKYNNTKYTKEDLFDISINIEVGTWYYSQFKVYDDWVIMYVIYNVGCGQYNKENKYWFYDSNGIWKNNHKNSFFYMNDLYPPEDNNHGMYGKNKLPSYNAKRRFEKCLRICKQYLNS